MTRDCDLVLGGGGVRGVAHLGALAALGDAGWRPLRVAGASAGAMAGALTVAGASPDQMREYLRELDYRGFAISDVLGRLIKRPMVGTMVERFATNRVDPLVWFDSLLAEHGVRTWADLKIDDDRLPPERRYRLVVRCLDVVRRRVVRLPWDYADYGLEIDEQSVSSAVRASMSVPMMFDPVTIGEGANRGLLVDGGMGSSFPAGIFDSLDGSRSDRPTFAVRLMPRAVVTEWPEGDFALVRAVVESILEANDSLEPVNACDDARTVRVDASRVTALDVRLSMEDEQALFTSGVTAMQEFLRGYDHDEWTAHCRP